jgi:ATP-dependent Clp protease adaptor protein ClpS
VAEDVETRTRTKTRPQTERPRLHKVILLNDDYTPREFVTAVLKAIFHMSEDEAHNAMMTAHQKGSCVIAVFTHEIAESKAGEANDAGQSAGFPLAFTTEPEE